MVAAIKGGHEEMLRGGMVVTPQVHAFVEGNLLGYIQLRPVEVGADADAGIAEMGDFAASAGADEVIVVWETQDVAVACGHAPRHEGAGLNILWAAAKRRTLHSFTYIEDPIGMTSYGFAAIAPRWTSSGIAQPQPELEPAITAVLDRSFLLPASADTDLFERTVQRLESQQYRIRLTV